MIIDTKSTLSELATSLSAASRIFHHHRLDFCCGGQRSLEEACAERELDPDAVLNAIAEASASKNNLERWDQASLRELIEHILVRYHEPLRPEIARLFEMAVKVERVHHDKPMVPRGLSAHLSRMAEDVEEHLTKEEQVLFPLVLGGHGQFAQAPIQVLSREHDDHGESLRRTRTLTNDLVPPPEACATWRALYLGLSELESDLWDHIHLENNILFPRALAR